MPPDSWPFSLHVDFKQNLSLAPTNSQKRIEGGLDSEKHPLNVERRERDKRSENERVGRRQRQTGSSGGLLIRDSLVSETFELTADLHESIIRLRCAAALIPPCVTRGEERVFLTGSLHRLLRESHRLGIYTQNRQGALTFTLMCLFYANEKSLSNSPIQGKYNADDKHLGSRYSIVMPLLPVPRLYPIIRSFFFHPGLFILESDWPKEANQILLYQ